MFIAQLIPGIDDTILYILAILVIVIYAAALLWQRTKRGRTPGRIRARGERLDYQPEAKPVWTPRPVPISWKEKKAEPAPAEPAPAREAPVQRAPAPEGDLLENCHDLEHCLHALAERYALDSFTIATSDGLVLASSGGESAQVDAARFSLQNGGEDSAGMALFGIDHKGSALTGIIRSSARISPDDRKRIERDTQDILNKWV